MPTHLRGLWMMRDVAALPRDVPQCARLPCHLATSLVRASRAARTMWFFNCRIRQQAFSVVLESGGSLLTAKARGSQRRAIRDGLGRPPCQLERWGNCLSPSTFCCYMLPNI